METYGLFASYYHQLLAGLSCFGIGRDAILFNAFTLIKPDFEVQNEIIFQEERLEKMLGYRKIHCNMNKAKLIRCISLNPFIYAIIQSFANSILLKLL